VVYARVPDSLKQSLHAHAAKRGLSLTQALVELVERGLEAIANANSRPRRASWPVAWTAQRRRARAAGPCASLSSSRPIPTERSPSGPGRTCRLPALPQARARLRPAGQRPLPQTATRRSPHRCCRPEPQTSSKTNTSRCWARSASPSASRSPPPIRTQPDKARSGARSRVTQREHDLHATRRRTRSQAVGGRGRDRACRPGQPSAAPGVLVRAGLLFRAAARRCRRRTLSCRGPGAHPRRLADPFHPQLFQRTLGRAAGVAHS